MNEILEAQQELFGVSEEAINQHSLSLSGSNNRKFTVSNIAIGAAVGVGIGYYRKNNLIGIAGWAALGAIAATGIKQLMTKQ
jgi:hypothetical protein